MLAALTGHVDRAEATFNVHVPNCSFLSKLFQEERVDREAKRRTPCRKDGEEGAPIRRSGD